MEKNRPLKIYLGDLTYTTVTLATEAFPLNVGFIASYCKKLFGKDVDITLFKYIEDIDRAVNEKPYQFATAHLPATTLNSCGLGRSTP